MGPDEDDGGSGVRIPSAFSDATTASEDVDLSQMTEEEKAAYLAARDLRFIASFKRLSTQTTQCPDHRVPRPHSTQTTGWTKSERRLSREQYKDDDLFEIDEFGKVRLKMGKKIDLSKISDDMLRKLGIDPSLSKKAKAKLLKLDTRKMDILFERQLTSVMTGGIETGT
ncbi:hypothetical protein ACOMHN_024378 [Nucella lapillus]